ncbi:ADP-heptose--lipooligosaccharide heptosyltransferase II [hydrothermal vent metagenome]|uniref:ADP-heptose--lipooligosaccharide heptosyltransferase II n=1 Tax=hydrothermal vent metagenome TaxID=652676 RepID=A0A3B0V926_9ZZZZ
MLQESFLTVTAARLASLPFRFAKRPFTTPQKALILHPCCLSRVMLATPLLSVLARAFPNAQFDWAVSDWGRPAVAKNPKLTELISTGNLAVSRMARVDLQTLIQKIRHESYDTCLIPEPSSLLSWVAWQAGIPQRIGVAAGGRGFAQTLVAPRLTGKRHAADAYLTLAQACHIDLPSGERPPMAFYPADDDRTAVTQRLIDDLDWLGDVPLVVIHPGGGAGSVFEDPLKRWPVERFVLLSNHLARVHNARILLVGSDHDRELTAAISGMSTVPCANWTGQMTLGELGALGEMASLYAGNDTGPTHIAAAVGCPTLAIFGPSDPTFSSPYSPTEGKVKILWRGGEERPFSWQEGVTVAEACKTADGLLHRQSKQFKQL